MSRCTFSPRAEKDFDSIFAFIAKDNPRAVKQFGKITVLGNVPYLDELDTHPARAWETFEECMPGLAEIQARIKS